MTKDIKQFFQSRIRNFFQSRFHKIHEINARYAVPRMHTSKAVSLSLIFLRVYLLFLVALLFYKFFTLI